jgi:hypothetical protein
VGLVQGLTNSRLDRCKRRFRGLEDPVYFTARTRARRETRAGRLLFFAVLFTVRLALDRLCAALLFFE